MLEVELKPCGGILSINLDNNETDLLFSLLEYVSREIKTDRISLEEKELAHKLSNELEFYTSWDIKK